MAKTFKADRVFLLEPFKNASVCVVSYSEGHLIFAVSIYEPTLTKIESTYKLEGDLIAAEP
jgi:hypothetical protein